MDAIKGTLAVLAALLVVAGLGVASWQFGWFVEEKNVDRRTGIDDRSLNRQQALTRKVMADISTVRDIDTQEQTPQVIAQREAIVENICENAGALTGKVTIGASAQTFIDTECP